MKSELFRKITALCACTALVLSFAGAAAFALDELPGEAEEETVIMLNPAENAAGEETPAQDAEAPAEAFEDESGGDGEDEIPDPAPAEDEDGDIPAPAFGAADYAISQLAFSRSSVGALTDVTVSIYPTKWVSGLRSGYAGFAAPGVSKELFVELHSYGDGVLTGAMFIGEYAASGDYSLSWITCYDTYGNFYNYMDVSGEIPAALKNSLKVTNPNGDNRPPEIKSFGFDSASAAPGAYIGVSAEASDLSGISTLYCNIYYDDGEYIDSLFLEKGSDGNYHSRLFVPESALGRSIVISDIYTQDNEENYCMFGLEGSPMPDGIQTAAVYCGTPVILNAQCTAKGIELSWSSVGAYAYRIYKSCEGAAEELCAEISGTFFCAEGLESGKKYSFSLECVTSTGKLASARSEAVSLVFYPSPVVSLGVTGSGIAVQWTAQSYASSYRVFYKEDGGSWKSAGVTSAAKLFINGLEDGKTYYVNVRCLDTAGEYIGTASQSVSIVFVKAPVIAGGVLEADGIKLNWNASGAAAGYRVFYREEGGQWFTAGDTAQTEYSVKNLKSGKNYEFYLRTLDGRGKCSSAAGEVFAMRYIAAPVFTVSQGTQGIKLSWAAVEGAGSYRVFYKLTGGEWQYTDTADTGFVFTGAKQDETFVFMLRCMNSDCTEYVSAYSQQKSIVYNNTPRITTVANHADYMIVSWTRVEGAVSYKLAFREGAGAWEFMNVPLTMVDGAGNPRVNLSTLVQGKAYTFIAYAVFADGTQTKSANATQMRLVTPVLSAKAYAGYIKLNWNGVDGGSCYKIYYRIKGGTWQFYASVAKGVTNVNIKETVVNQMGTTSLIPGFTYEFMVLSATSVAGITSGYPTSPVSVRY